MDRTAPMPGGFNNSCAGNCTCMPSGNNPSGNIQTAWTGTPYRGKIIHNNPAFWGNNDAVHVAQPYLFIAPSKSPLIQYPLCSGTIDTLPICGRLAPRLSVGPGGGAIVFNYGVTPSVSASSPTSSVDAIVWALASDDKDASNPQSTTPGILYAFDAQSMVELYSSNTCSGRDQIAAVTKFSVPTVANGYVYVGAEELSNGVNNGTGTFYIFAPNSGTCSTVHREVEHHEVSTRTVPAKLPCGLSQ
jgi:hypothetical protein